MQTLGLSAQANLCCDTPNFLYELERFFEEAAHLLKNELACSRRESLRLRSGNDKVNGRLLLYRYGARAFARRRERSVGRLGNKRAPTPTFGVQIGCAVRETTENVSHLNPLTNNFLNLFIGTNDTNMT
jgi:hypothetical protein